MLYIQKMPLFRLRIDFPRESSGKVADWLQTFATSFLLVHHTDIHGNNSHYHALIDTKFVQITVRQYVKRLDPFLIGNGKYSVQDCSPDRKEEYATYLFNLKRGNVPSFCAEVGFPEWETYREASAKLTEEFNKTESSKTITKDAIVQQLITLYQGDNVNRDFVDILDDVMAISRSRKTVFSLRALTDIVGHIAYWNGQPQARAGFRESVLRNFYPPTR